MSVIDLDQRQDVAVSDCPDWCTLPAGHAWDYSTPYDYTPDGPILMRMHQGPKFGTFDCEAMELTTEPGKLRFNVANERSHLEIDFESADLLAEYALNATRAAEWLREVSRAPMPTAFTNLCPDWCELPADHQVDTIHGNDNEPHARRSRGHQGPRFGAYVSTGSFEFTDAPGIHHYDLTVVGDAVEQRVETPAAAHLLCEHLAQAAAWVSEQEAAQ